MFEFVLMTKVYTQYCSKFDFSVIFKIKYTIVGWSGPDKVQDIVFK